MQQQGRFIEWGERNGVFYGTASEPSAVKDNVRRRQTSKTARALKSGTAIQTVLLGRNAAGKWGFELAGDVHEGMLPRVAKLTDERQLAYSVPLAEGDHVLAVNGVSVAGAPIEFAHKQMLSEDKDLELTVLSAEDSKGNDLRQVFDAENTSSSEELKMLQADVRADIYHHKVPFTTRAPKEGEIDGQTYHFITRNRFLEMKKEGLFLESGEVNGILYGTSLEGNNREGTRSSRAHHLTSVNASTRPKRFTIDRHDDEAFGMNLTDGHKGGAVISAVVDGGPADRAGLRPGMQIVSVGSEDMVTKSIDDVAAAMQDVSAGGQPVSVVVRYIPAIRNVKFSGLAAPFVRGAKAQEDSKPCKRIHLWSTPRSHSTALMYSFGQRSDTHVVDEPLYACWLKKHPEAVRSYRAEVLEKMETDTSLVVDEVLRGNFGSDVVFYKHMCKQNQGLSEDVLREGVHVVLVRNPISVINSWKQEVKPSVEELGFADAVRTYSMLRQRNLPVVVIDSDILRQHPELMLREVCAATGLEFEPAMLSWPAGPKPYDGLWADVWYKTLHQSTSFDSKPRIPQPLPDEYVSLVEDCYPFYHMLRQHAVGSRVSSTKLALSAASGDGLDLPRLPDARNSNLIASVGGLLVPRSFASVSAFDSAVQGGDAVWEGLRLYNGRVFNMEPHLQRLVKSAKAMAFEDVPTIDEIKNDIFNCLAANNMRDGVHVRLTLSRGLKTTSSMNPRFNSYGTTLIVLPEWKPVEGATTYDNVKGIKLITAAQRRNPPQCIDSKIHHCNLINNILPKIQANNAGANDALMLDTEGFVCETNATNVFAVIDGSVVTPHGDFCLPGTTRRTVMDICAALNLSLEERRVSLSEFHSADEVFTTGSMGELTPVCEIDGRKIGSGERGSVTERIQSEYRRLTNEEGVALPF